MLRRPALLIFPLFCLTPKLFPQTFEQQFRPFTVIQSGDTLINPFSGGIDTPLHQFVDIDGDGDLDLFILDRDGRLTFYRNDGTPSAPKFVLANIGFQNLDVGAWFKFVDIDADGDYDLFCNGPSSTVNFYRNVGTKFLPSFVREITGVKDTSGALILSETISVPTFADLDGDGDLDMFSGNSVGSIWYYENVGTPTNFRFHFVTDTYQNLIIIGSPGSSLMSMPPRGLPAGTAERERHGAMAITFADIDGDGVLDLFWGDFFNRSLYFIQNQGTRTNPKLVLTDSTYPKEAKIFSTGYNMPSLVDMDGDGRLDMVIGVLSGASSYNNFMYYRNVGTPFLHQFQLQTMNFLPAIDVGSTSSPVFADVDGDGDMDLLIGSEDGKLALFERKGTKNSAVFEFKTNNYVNLAGLFNISPAFADIDGDGKLELIVGDANGKLRLYRNNNVWSEDTTFQLRSMNFGQNASPVLVDIDGDGKQDLFVGTGGGRIYYFHNDGTAASPDFVLQTNFFLSIDVGDDAKPTFADLDNDGDQDLIVGARDGQLYFWRNDGTLTAFTFTSVPGYFAGVTAVIRSAPAFEDVDGDGRKDLFLGNVKGGLYFYSNKATETQPPTSFLLDQNFPNPFNAGTTIRYQLTRKDHVVLTVFNMLGQEIRRLVDEEEPAGFYSARFDALNLPSGIYFYRIVTGDHVGAKKMIIIR